MPATNKKKHEGSRRSLRNSTPATQTNADTQQHSSASSGSQSSGRRRKRGRKMAFQDLYQTSTSVTGDNEISTPRATPPHTRAFMAGSPRRNTTTPARAQTGSPSSARPAIPQQQQRRQTESLTMNGPQPPSRMSQHFRNGTGPKAPINPSELKIYVMKVPLPWTTWDVCEFFKPYGTVARVELEDPRTLDKNAIVVFRPAPPDVSWMHERCVPGYGPTGQPKRLDVKDNSRPVNTQPSTFERGRWLPESMSIPLLKIDFGIMQQEKKMLIMHTTPRPDDPQVSQLTFDLHEKAVFVTFLIQRIAEPSKTRSEPTAERFKMRINAAQIHRVYAFRSSNGDASIVFTVEHPPMFYRKTTNIQATHDDKSTLWDGRQTWYRQTDIDHNPLKRVFPTALRKQAQVVETGRWLTYRLHFSQAALNSQAFRDMLQALEEHNVKLVWDETFDLSWDLYNDGDALWNWLESPTANDAGSGSGSFMAELHELAEEPAIHLPFLLRYQLEVCLSLGVLHECNVTRDFMKKLSSIDPQRATKVLQKVADAKKRYYEPMNIFKLQHQVSVVEKKRPGYCTKIPSATVTPTTIYFSTPVLETSNRVIRQFQQHEDRFLRVKFMDDGKWGIRPQDDRLMDEVFSRISRTMTHGIKIGDRLYEFLAFGSSQFREHGAYFFASTDTLTAEMIRQWMGNFTSIKNIAKYCSRLGQCFSTTRAIPHTISVERIADVERSGFCFTDGVGKISPLLARMIANHFKIPDSEQDYPSMFQFRLAGCKGVLAVEPALKGMTIQIRPSQEKFPANFYGLEICRISQFSAANLNVQLILVLSALGVPDEVFVKKLQHMIAEMEAAMTDERKALMMLQKNVDFNQMTLTLCNMIFDGFMETQDPFFVTCLRLWRSWSLKYLKEKARIFVEEGAFVFGGTDETASLKGHYDTTGTLQDGSGVENEPSGTPRIPEIFLQIPDAEGNGKYRVIHGLCFVARNPSLHPGDVRVVRAVDVPALRHLKNVVVFPQTGDRDVPNMLSGGDLDGDDYIVSWDQDLMPREQNHSPMDYTGPTPAQVEDRVTTKDMARFFVNHIKHDNLSRIAVAHRYHADYEDEGIKHPKCLELADLHSRAVDSVKTGVEVVMPKHLKIQRWPHWSEPKNKSKRKIYRSHKVLGKLYDEVHLEPFKVAWDLPFDERILQACEPSEQMLKDAKEMKVLYDEAVHRVMKQHGIQSEFEVWTTFVLEHHQDINDYKFGELIGETFTALRQEYQEICYVKAGTTSADRDWDKLKEFIVAMYKVTAEEVAEAKENSFTRDPQVAQDMPFISFPWLFQRELGQIATGGRRTSQDQAMPRPTAPKQTNATKKLTEILGDDFAPPPLPEVSTVQGPVREGDVLDLFHDEDSSARRVSSVETLTHEFVAPASEARVRQDSAQEVTPSAQQGPGATVSATEAEVPLLETLAVKHQPSAEVLRLKKLYDEAKLPTDTAIPLAYSSTTQDTNANAGHTRIAEQMPLTKSNRVMTAQSTAASRDIEQEAPTARPSESSTTRNVPAKENSPPEVSSAPAQVSPSQHQVNVAGEDGDEDVCEEVTIEVSSKPSGLDKLAALIGFDEEE